MAIDLATANVRLHEYIVQLETTRRDLMRVNEELHEKIGALERGQEYLRYATINECLSVCSPDAGLCNCRRRIFTLLGLQPIFPKTKDLPGTEHFNGC